MEDNAWTLGPEHPITAQSLSGVAFFHGAVLGKAQQLVTELHRGFVVDYASNRHNVDGSNIEIYGWIKEHYFTGEKPVGCSVFVPSEIIIDYFNEVEEDDWAAAQKARARYLRHLYEGDAAWGMSLNTQDLDVEIEWRRIIRSVAEATSGYKFIGLEATKNVAEAALSNYEQHIEVEVKQMQGKNVIVLYSARHYIILPLEQF